MKKFLTVFLVIVLCLINISPVNVHAATIKISKKSAVVIEGDYLYLNLVGTKKKPSWSSSDKLIATVDKKGKVTSMSPGKTTITAKLNKKKYTCKVVVIPNIDPDYKTDKDIEYELAERDYLDKYAESTTVIIPTPMPNEKVDPAEEAAQKEKRSLMIKYGFSSSDELDTEIGKAYMEFCDEWVSEHELKNYFDTSVVPPMMDDKLYLITNVDNRYIIYGAPQKPVNGTIYTNGEVQYQYLEKFEHDGQSYTQNQYFFNREDLVKIGIIK